MSSNGFLSTGDNTPTEAQDAVLKPSEPVPEGAVPVQGLDFDAFADRNVTVAELVENLKAVGFQATSIGQAVDIVNGMVSSQSRCLYPARVDLRPSGLGGTRRLAKRQQSFSATLPI